MLMIHLLELHVRKCGKMTAPEDSARAVKQAWHRISRELYEQPKKPEPVVKKEAKENKMRFL